MGKHFRKTENRKSRLKRCRSKEYRGNTKKGFRQGSGWLWQAHHILCNHAVEGREIPGDADYVDFVEDCLWITDWDLNDPHNMIGLPTNRQYRLSNGLVPVDLPSHQVGHNTAGGYTEECREYLKENVWNSLEKKKEPHEIDAKDLAQQLKDATDLFHGRIKDRGLRPKANPPHQSGTAYCWERRFKSHPEHEEKWFHPFSMAKKPSSRHPGINPGNLTNVFKKIG